MSHIHSLSWYSTLEPACCINSPSSVSHWYVMMRQMLQVLWLIGWQDETLDKLNHWERELGGADVMLTNTHIFCFFPYRWGKKWDMMLIQAFTVPDDQPLAGDRNGILHLSHEGILFQESPCAVIWNSIVDPITGSVSVRFLSQWNDLPSNGLHPKCVDVTLHKPSPVDVSPITVRWHAVLTSENGPPLHWDLDFHHHFFDTLGDGHARGLFTKLSHYPADADTEVHPSYINRSAVVKFKINATQECCIGKNTGIPPGVSGHTRTRTRTNTRTRMVGVGNHTGMSHSTLGYTCTWVYPRVLHFYWSSVGICSKCVCSMFTMCS